MCQQREEVLRNASPGDHAAYLYVDVAALLVAITEYGQAALQRGDAFLLVATRENIDGVRQRLNEAGYDCEALAASGQLVTRDAEELLAAIMRSGEPNREVFEAIVRPLIEAAQQLFGGAAVYGELVNLLWRQGDRMSAHRLEQWWNELIAEYKISLLCGYRVDPFDFHEEVQSGISAICSTHSHLIPVAELDRLEHAVDEAMRRVFRNGDAAALRKHLLERGQRPTKMPPAQAALLRLHDILPSLAQDVRMLARDLYMGSARS